AESRQSPASAAYCCSEVLLENRRRSGLMQNSCLPEVSHFCLKKWPSENGGTISLNSRLTSRRSDPTRCLLRTVLRWREFREPTRAKRPRSTGAEAVLSRRRGTRPRLQRHSRSRAHREKT